MKEFIPNQASVRKQVRRVFPDAPDHCLDCPGLRVATGVLLGGDAFLARISTDPENPENPFGKLDAEETEEGIIMGLINNTLNNIYAEENEEVPSAAKELWDNCPEGTFITKVRQGFFGAAIFTAYCVSESPYAKFIAPVEINKSPY